ncbi:MAG: 50S ribosomal protein L3 [Candidatus Omnitrophica bacterium]|nr:50S ribosomal protein L3 [Candidatus Omnitrophota bacterium]
MSGMIGRKLGMTQIFDKDGNLISVTVVESGPCTVLDVKEDGQRVTLGYGDIKESRLGKPRLGLFKKIGVEPRRVIREFKSSDTGPYKVGMKISARLFKAGDYVDISGTSIGKGFQGGMKRHHWSGGPGGHGSMHHRRVGSIGMSADPSRTLKGRTMPGQMGNKRITTQGLRVMEIDADNNIILVKGAVPGHKNGIVSINISRKKKWRDLNEVAAVVQHKVNPMKQSKAKAGVKKKGK